MVGPRTITDILHDLDPTWPPMRHVKDGWDRLKMEERARVLRRLDMLLTEFEPPEGVHDAALRRFFSFLAQMEVIAIEVPLASLAEANPDSEPLLERQVADEVFHATLFASLATRMGGLDDPIPEAEDLLDRIRAPDDPRTSAVLLNQIAEGWFETLFEHAATWGVADRVFQVALADEERHVEEGDVHAEGVTPEEVEPAVRSLEEELFNLVQNPKIMLPTLALAGEANLRSLWADYLTTHEEALARVGLRPRLEFQEMVETLDDLTVPLEDPADLAGPRRVDAESRWRETALHLWDTPRHPVMHGWFDVETEHIPTRALTAVLVAAVGRVWHEYPRVNRYTLGGEVYEPDGVTVGVRVALGDQQEALSTIAIPEAHERSLRDIQRILETGVREMNEFGRGLEGVELDATTEPLRNVLRDEELMGMAPPGIVTAPVTVSNVGASGLVAGVGAMPGALGQSVEIIVGREEQRPVWNGDRYVPGDVVTIGSSADHRVIDGHHAAEAMDRMREALSEEGVAEVLAREDTIPADADLANVVFGEVGVTQQQAQILMSCKAPFWLGWLCWVFKK